MAGNHLGDGATVSAGPKALVLRGESVSAEEQKLAGLLDCLEVPWQAVPVAQNANHWSSSGSSEQYSIVSPATHIATLLDAGDQGQQELRDWIAKAESLYVYGFGEDARSQKVLRFLTGSPRAKIRSFKAQQAVVSVTKNFPELCGPMSGLQFRASIPREQTAFDFSTPSSSPQNIIDSEQGPLFAAYQFEGTRIFLNAGAQVVDVRTTCVQFFDVRENFCETVPLVMWAKLDFGLGAAEISGCLIVDDPPLKPRYGFLNYHKTLRLMDRHNFATTIAFIPWNWSRTEGRTVQLFHERPDRYSICVHGCDHTAKEFAEESPAVLNKRLSVAKRRMQLLKQRTSLPHDDVMVFPQGAFSGSAVRALKVNGFTAAVNTEVAPRIGANETTVGDLLGMAIMKYSSFPVFTRRYVFHGVENFAFDGLLGKPCLIAAHHDDFMDESRKLLELITQLNALNWELRWRALGETLRRASSIRRRTDGRKCVEMYGTHLRYGNSHEGVEQTKFIKRENDFESVKAVTANGEPVDYLHQDGYLQFEAAVRDKESVDLRVIYASDGNLASSLGDLSYRAKALVRRYLSEFRDNYLSRNANLQQSAVKLKQALGL